ncbi:MAG: trigger factor [Candidatus Nealsonbacteria bacterium]|nr:trigger factor [Candidatus Nealsonbacteria bacterium]
MKPEIKKIKDSQIEITDQVSSEDFEKYKDQAILFLSKDLDIKGFRRGAVPKDIAKNHLSQDKVLTEARRLAIQKSYFNILKENNFDPLGEPEVEILNTPNSSQLEFRIKVAVMPEVWLPDYKNIASKVQRKKAEVQNDDVEKALKYLQRSRASFSLKEGACQRGDFVEIEYSSPNVYGGKLIKDEFFLGEGKLLEGIEESIEGMKAGENKEIKAKGKDMVLKLRMLSVKKAVFPQVNDEFAKSLGSFESLANLEKNIREGLSAEKESEESQRVRTKILSEISDQTKVEIPSILVKEEQGRMLASLKDRVKNVFGAEFEEYLKQVKKSEEDLLADFSSSANSRVKNFLILREIEKKENIVITQEEINEEANKILKSYSSVGQAKKNIDEKALKEYSAEILKQEKTLAMLESFAK